jgi:hypothetical protein
MSKLRAHISTSLDGYVAGPNQSAENPLGEGGEALHEWAFELKAIREPHGMEGGTVNARSEAVPMPSTSTSSPGWSTRSSCTSFRSCWAAALV